MDASTPRFLQRLSVPAAAAARPTSLALPHILNRTTSALITTSLAPPAQFGTPRLYRAPNQDPDREKMMQEGRCFECKQQGHMSRDCPQKKKASDQIRAVEEDTPEQGKD